MNCIPVKGSPGFRCNGGDVTVTQNESSATIITPNVRVECIGCIVTRFGYPNDEALPGDPLYSAGLKYYNIVEITDSPWLAEINARNLRCFPKFKGFKAKHYYMSFHDSSFEVLCEDISFH